MPSADELILTTAIEWLHLTNVAFSIRQREFKMAARAASIGCLLTPVKGSNSHFKEHGEHEEKEEEDDDDEDEVEAEEMKKKFLKIKRK